MTPLPRWVLLALLLAVAEAEPEDYACVRLCRARSSSPNVAGVCYHEQNRLLQSSGGRFQSLFSFCLTPCTGSPFLDLACRSVRNSLIKQKSCSCDGLPDVINKNPEEFMQRFVEDVKTLETGGKLLNLFLKLAGRQSAQRFLYGETMKMEDEEEEPVEAAVLNTVRPVEAGPTEAPVDWEIWCMNQCDNGQGGSACNCDIIP